MNKKLLASVLIFAALCGSIFAGYTKQNSRLAQGYVTVAYNSGGTATSVRIETQLKRQFVNDADATDVSDDSHTTTLTFDLLDASLASTNITAAGKTVTYPQLAALLREAVLDRANAAGIP